jgi:small redox-active disulfide protein 2
MSSLVIEVLGTGCKKCNQLEENAKVAIAQLNLEAEVVHIKDPLSIAERGVMKTPALIVDGQLVSQGKVPTSEQIQNLLSGA